jgi:hypothetical protein
VVSNIKGRTSIEGALEQDAEGNIWKHEELNNRQLKKTT